MSITCVTLLLHFSDVRSVFDVIQQCENGGRTYYGRFDISTYYLGMNCSENSLSFEVMWMELACHVDGISRSRGRDKEIPHGALPMEQLVLSDKWARKSFPVKLQNNNLMFAYAIQNRGWGVWDMFP